MPACLPTCSGQLVGEGTLTGGNTSKYLRTNLHASSGCEPEKSTDTNQMSENIGNCALYSGGTFGCEGHRSHEISISDHVDDRCERISCLPTRDVSDA